MKSGVTEAFCEFFLTAIGATIPDMILSVIVARKGYASMALSNCIGSQIGTICIGLGFPWLLDIVSYDLSAEELSNNENGIMPTAAYCQGTAMVFCFTLLFAPVIRSGFKQKWIYLSKFKGCVLFFVFTVTISTFGVVQYFCTEAF